MPMTRLPLIPCRATGERLKRRLLLLAMLGVPFAHTHAAGIRVVHSEVSPSVTAGTLRNILVLGWGARQDMRQLFEDSVVQGLHALSVGATASHKRLNADEVRLRSAVTRIVKAEGCDGVLVARLIATEGAPSTGGSAKRENPQASLEAGLAHVEARLATAPNGFAAVTETSLYRVADGARVWSAFTDVQDPRDVAETTKDYAAVVVAELRRHKLV